MPRDIPLGEITLRRYEKPYNAEKREIMKKVCLSLGLLQPGDSRDIMVDILYTLLQNKSITSENLQGEVIQLRKKYNLPLKGIAPSNIRRQLKRLRDIFIIEKIKNEYRLIENEKLSTIFEEKIEKFYMKSIVDRVKEYLKAV